MTSLPRRPSAGRAKSIRLAYNPTPLQDQMAKAIAGGARVILALGGIRSGKTYGALMEGYKQIYQYQKKPNLGWIVSPTYPMSLVPERLWKRMAIQADGTNLIAHERRGERAFLMWPPSTMRDRFYRVEFKSADDPDRLRGASIAWAILDEGAIMKPEAFDILRGRVLDSGGIIIIPTTPKGKNWLYHDIYLKSLEDVKYAVVEGKTSENQYLDQQEIEKLYHDYSVTRGTELAKQEMEGKFVDFAGLVFDQFRPGDHIVAEKPIPDDLKVICGIDWGYNDPFVCVWLAKIDGVWVVVDEYYKPHGLLKDHAAYIKNHKLWPQVKTLWCDPSGLQQRKEFLALGIKTLAARRPDHSKKTDWPVMRARTINNLFSNRLRSPWDHAKLIPGLVYFDTILHGMRETMSLCYERYTIAVEDEKTGRAVVRTVDISGDEVEKNAGEHIQDKDNHFVDALGYAVFSEVRVLKDAFHAHYKDERTGTIVEQKPKTLEEANHEEMESRCAEADKKLHKPARMMDVFDSMNGLDMNTTHNV